METVDLTVVISVIGAAVAVFAGLWKGVPEIAKALAERDGIVADTYQQVLHDVKEELLRLKDEAHEAQVSLSAARIQIDDLGRQNRELISEVHALRAQVVGLEAQVKAL